MGVAVCTISLHHFHYLWTTDKSVLPQASVAVIYATCRVGVAAQPLGSVCAISNKIELAYIVRSYSKRK